MATSGEMFNFLQIFRVNESDGSVLPCIILFILGVLISNRLATPCMLSPISYIRSLIVSIKDGLPIG